MQHAVGAVEIVIVDALGLAVAQRAQEREHRLALDEPELAVANDGRRVRPAQQLEERAARDAEQRLAVELREVLGARLARRRQGIARHHDTKLETVGVASHAPVHAARSRIRSAPSRMPAA